MTIDDNTELDRKSKDMEVSLEGGVVGADEKHIKEKVADQTVLRWDYSIANKEKD